MENFVQLIKTLDRTTSYNQKVGAIINYFDRTHEEEAICALYILIGKNFGRPIKPSLLREWAAACAQLPSWLFESSYHTVGDLAETIALLLSKEKLGKIDSLQYYIQKLQSLRKSTDEEKKIFVLSVWAELDRWHCFVFNKLITGGFRIGVSEKLIAKALAKKYNLSEAIVLHRLMGSWQLVNQTVTSLLLDDAFAIDGSRPFPFCLAHGFNEADCNHLNLGQWHVSYKWDGIRCQIVKRNDELFLWSRGEELINNQFPDLCKELNGLPNGLVVDAELLVYKNNQVGTFNDLQRRLGRKKPSAKLLNELPIKLFCFDLLEYEGRDIRDFQLKERILILKNLVDHLQNSKLVLPPELMPETWDEAALMKNMARTVNAEGLMIKNLAGKYESGRKKGNWYKWKLDPFTVDAVLIYAQSGHGRRANLFTDYTFAVWHQQQLVPVAKAYSGLTDKEILEVDAFVKKNTLERFGPVRSVSASLVFEIAFEGIQLSTRHKSGVAMRFPRILRWRKDKLPEQADHLDYLKSLIHIT
ncbi:MAG: ligase [Bacteroidota bacterium]|jgi:DNA ligase-1